MTLRWRAVTGLIVAALCLTVAGCSSDASVDSDLRLQLQRSIASVQSQQLALELQASGRTTSAVTRVACDDAAEEVATVQQKVATLTVDSAHQAERRDAALDAVTGAVTATVAARDGACRQPDGEQAQLATALKELVAVRDRLGAGR